MKNVAIVLLIVVLAVIVWVQYGKLNRLSPPEDYEYAFREDLDLDYHNPVVLREYYETGYQVGSYAREMWRAKGINVRLPEADNSEEHTAARHYNRLRAYTDSLGARLSRSLKMKQQGYNNAEIATMESEGLSSTQLQLRKVFGAESLKKGDKSAGVFALQTRLMGEGYNIPHDGYFWNETEEAIRQYQTKNQLLPSGLANRELLVHLLTKGGK